MKEKQNKLKIQNCFSSFPLLFFFMSFPWNFLFGLYILVENLKENLLEGLWKQISDFHYFSHSLQSSFFSLTLMFFHATPCHSINFNLFSDVSSLVDYEIIRVKKETKRNFLKGKKRNIQNESTRVHWKKPLLSSPISLLKMFI